MKIQIFQNSVQYKYHRSKQKALRRTSEDKKSNKYILNKAKYITNKSKSYCTCSFVGQYIYPLFEIILILRQGRWGTIFASQGFRSRSPLFSEERGDRERNPWLAKMVGNEQNLREIIINL